MSKRILILDDDTELLDVLQILLTDAGYEAILIAETNDLVSLVRTHQPTLIILDFRLKYGNGGEWCAKLKSHPEFKMVPVMIYTACSRNIEKGSYGCDDFLAKPFDIAEMLTRINHLIDNATIPAKGHEKLTQVAKTSQMINHYDSY